MANIPQKELRNNIGEVLRRAEAGEELTITVSGRPVARLGPPARPAAVGRGAGADRGVCHAGATDARRGSRADARRARRSLRMMRVLLDTSVLIGETPHDRKGAISPASLAEPAVRHARGR
jgi:prevent-host-death family protein